MECGYGWLGSMGCGTMEDAGLLPEILWFFETVIKNAPRTSDIQQSMNDSVNNELFLWFVGDSE